ncbi:divalent-cation tolerance protein CutA [Henriciella marina]|uniref:divalent-cation tolerance protein CutA n=1 Tax=Henriciella marina TaxID=453851 RepID=UPI00035DD535|nr:divalent-cation tolerance protein CutA [Henriciella marina]
MTDALLIRITCPGMDVAQKIADASVEKKLAACANIEGPVSSTYLWKGVVEQAFEHILWLKSVEACWSGLEALVKDLHPYDVPAMIAWPCTHVLADYADWLTENTEAPAR